MFRQNDRRGCSLPYIDGFGYFLFGFGAAVKNSRGTGNHPLGKTMVNTGKVCVAKLSDVKSEMTPECPEENFYKEG